jgi:hypothetical protein
VVGASVVVVVVVGAAVVAGAEVVVGGFPPPLLSFPCPFADTVAMSPTQSVVAVKAATKTTAYFRTNNRRCFH